ncbi:RNA polymerase sigma-70 factor [Mucilaginibacter sp.]|uniref:RNA polymerase sigma factor n=1 Tax=Mucilaginibacter sp. TaxID=1882438 RepID=UPI002ED66EBE
MRDYKDYVDRDLVTLLENGDSTAYEEIFRRYNRVLYGHAYKKLKNKEEAQDLVQDVFATLWLKRAELQIVNNLAGYLYSSVRNRFYNIIAHKDIQAKYIDSLQHFLDQPYELTDTLVREKEFAALIDKEIQTLPPRMRLVFEMSRKRHLSYKEIAEELKISEETVKDQIKKALKFLRPRLLAIFHLIFLLKNI